MAPTYQSGRIIGKKNSHKSEFFSQLGSLNTEKPNYKINFGSSLIYLIAACIAFATWMLWDQLFYGNILLYQDLGERFFSHSIDNNENGNATKFVTLTTESDLIPLEELEAIGVKTPLFKAPKLSTKSTRNIADNTVSNKTKEEGLFISPVILTPQQEYGEMTVRKVTSLIAKFGKKKGVKPAMLARAIVKESKAQLFDPLFVAAVIKTESAFATDAISPVGARGLMQIMPGTKAHIETFPSLSGLPRGTLTEPGYNLALGITYLKYLESMFDGNRVLTLIAYNWGPGHLKKTVMGEKKGVPRQVVNYALRILGDHQRWRREIAVASSMDNNISTKKNYQFQS